MAAARRVDDGDARHHPTAGQRTVSLAAAQLVIARELGFSSWPKLKAAVDAAAAGPSARDHAFVAASIEGRLKEAAALWQADPHIASRSLLAAVVLGDVDAVRARLAADPESALAVDDDLPDRLTDDDRAAMVGDAASASSAAVELTLESRLSPHGVNGFGEQALQTAAYQGNAAVVRVPLDAGADIDARDGRFDSTPLAFATVGSGEQVGKPGDWIETVRLLIAAGASRSDVWISMKPPSEEVAEVLRHYGITPGGAAEQRPDDHQAEVAGSVGTGVIAEIARHLETAYRDRDLDLLASLLHPQVHWTGLCQNSRQVLDWYRGLLSGGVVATVQGVEVNGDAVVLSLSLAGQAEGSRPAPPQHLYHVFAVEDAQVVEIRGDSDRASALARS